MRIFFHFTTDRMYTCCTFTSEIKDYYYYYMKKEDNSLIKQFIVYVHRNEAHFTYIYVYLRLTTFTKTLPQMSLHLYFLLFLFRSGAPPMTLLTAGVLTDLRLPATASNVCTTDARLGGVGRVPPPPPKQKSWLCRWP